MFLWWLAALLFLPSEWAGDRNHPVSARSQRLDVLPDQPGGFRTTGHSMSSQQNSERVQSGVGGTLLLRIEARRLPTLISAG
jgi:hypothetical protein